MIQRTTMEKRQPILFVFSGGMQYLLDVILFSVFFFLNFDYKLSNILSRCTAGGFGFLFNGYVVFGSLRKCSYKIFLRSLFKFLCLLLFQTFLSTLIIGSLSSITATNTHMIIIKCVTEILMAIFSYFVQKFFVYGSARDNSPS